MRSLLLALSLLSVAGALDWPQSPAAPPQDPSRFATSTTAVSVDVVVRDKHGKSVFDLAREDFEVLEDAVPQEVTSFLAPRPLPLQTAAAPPEAPSMPTPPIEPAGARPPSDASLIAFVFGYFL